MNPLPLSLTIIFRLAPFQQQPIELARHPHARKRCISKQGQACARAVIHARQYPEPAAVRQLIGYEVDALAFVGSKRNHHGRPRSDGPLAPAPVAHGWFSLTIKREQLLVVHDMSIPRRQNMQTPVAKAPTLVGRRLHTHAHRATAYGFTSPPFAHPVNGHDMSDGFPLGSGRYPSFQEVLQRPERLGFRDVHVADFGLPFVNGGVTGTVLAAKVSRENPLSCSFKIPMICSSEKRFRFMLRSSQWARNVEALR